MNQLAVLLAVCVIGGFVSMAIASSKGLSAGGYFLLGLLLPLIGIIVAAVAPRPTPVAGPPIAPGWHEDPWHQASMRYHDGSAWTYHTHSY